MMSLSRSVACTRRAGYGIARRLQTNSIAAVIVLAALAPTLASTSETGALVSDGWRLFTRDDVQPARFSPNGPSAISVANEDGFALLYRPVTSADGEARVLRWRWRVETAPPASDLTQKGRDDRPVAVHVWFPDRDGGPLTWLKRELGSALFGVPVPGRAITYVWGGRTPRSTMVANPYLEGGIMKILRPGDTVFERWFHEQVDVRADFEAAFGEPAPRPGWIAISSDTEDLGGRARAVVAELAFTDGVNLEGAQP